MKKLIILMLWLFLMIPASSASANKFIQTTKQLHRSDKINYVDTEVGNTLNLYKISNTPSNGKKLYNPLNIQFVKTNSLSLKERRALKKLQFFKDRRSRKLKRKMKKIKFYQERRRKKFQNQIYLWRWFQKTQLQVSRLAIS